MKNFDLFRDFAMKILIAEDEDISRRRLEEFLKELNHQVISCKDGLKAWEVIQSENAPNLLILDWMMPGMNGVEICRKVRDLANESYTYILLLNSKSEQEDIDKGMEAGADDNIFKPFNENELKARLRVGTRIVRMNKYLLGMRNDLRKQAIYDELTGLHNRRYMSEIFKNEFSRSLRHYTDLSCLLLDIDFFKRINDTFGHGFGDFVLQGFSACIKQNARKQDFSFRHGGEEFMILLPNTGIDGALRVAEKIRTTCENTTHEDGTNTTTVTVSIGIASINHHHPSDGKELIAFADKALYRAKAEGRNMAKVYGEGPSVQSVNVKSENGKDVNYLKENISSILEKTKKVSIESLELLVRGMYDPEHLAHNKETKRYIELIGKKLLLPGSIIETIKRTSTLHDSFSILIDESMKRKGKELDPENHPYAMVDIIESFELFNEERNVLTYHHEKYDGSGYPEGLSYNDIPVGAKIFAIADAIAAMLSERSHKKSMLPGKVIEELADNAGSQFDPMIVSLFLNIVEEEEILAVPGDILTKAKEKVSKALSGRKA